MDRRIQRASDNLQTWFLQNSGKSASDLLGIVIARDFFIDKPIESLAGIFTASFVQPLSSLFEVHASVFEQPTTAS